MPQPTIRLATVEDMRAITSKNADDLRCLPFLYIASAESGVMRVWGVARGPDEHGESSVVETERLYPGALVAPTYLGETAAWRAAVQRRGAGVGLHRAAGMKKPGRVG